jgi:hypothetical protein
MFHKSLIEEYAEEHYKNGTPVKYLERIGPGHLRKRKKNCS